MSGNVYLTGFMGAGKSTAGRALAESLGRRFVDMDEVLAEEMGRPIREVFEVKGEAFFRRRESALLVKLARRSLLVVATGGGLPGLGRNRDVMSRSGRIVYLSAELETCRRRLGPEEIANRPMWRDEARLTTLFDERRGLYRECDQKVPVDGLKPSEIVNRILEQLAPEERFTVRLGEDACPVEATLRAPIRLPEMIDGRRAALVTDSHVAELHLERYGPCLKNATRIILRPGERTKTLDGARRVYEALMAARFNRDDLLIALGGGVMTDLGAFVAATYKRGMPFLLVSTSLLGCVDAAVGGKAGVNLGQAKNAVGCFTIPEGVILDAAAFRTLGRPAVRDGLVEAYKTGLVAAPELAGLIESNAGPLLAGDTASLLRVAASSARAKGDVVARDFREGGWRGILNFGHTFGHAVEGWGQYRVSHGRAVAQGMILALALSRDRGLLDRGNHDRMSETVRRIMPGRVEWPPLEEAWEIMSHDKKVRQGRLVFALLEGPGRPVLVNDVTRDELCRAVASVEV
ncbi:MAG: bifunctional shikimate kinase/3-dehydroquinate synthase [Proteobacteria bacterium]|nr:bifunctional shikimate kinase/3-dehydroquinate synthase [Pseudomonadota bacterium]